MENARVKDTSSREKKSSSAWLAINFNYSRVHWRKTRTFQFLLPQKFLLWSILVVRLAHSADLRSRLRHVSGAPSVAYSTGCSRVVTHPGTNPARRCLTSVIWREPVCHRRLAATDRNVLPQSIHRHKRRRGNPLVHVVISIDSRGHLPNAPDRSQQAGAKGRGGVATWRIQLEPSKSLAMTPPRFADKNHFSGKMTFQQKMATNERTSRPAGHEFSENFKFWWYCTGLQLLLGRATWAFELLPPAQKTSFLLIFS